MDDGVLQELEKMARAQLQEQHAPGEVEALLRILREDFWLTSKIALPARSKDYQSALARVRVGEPVQYVVGSAHFFGHDFKVDPSVLIPRPETEELVQLVIESSTAYSAPVILDVGTGSGCIAISLAKQLPQAVVEGLDVSEEALKIARLNNIQMGTAVNFTQCDFLDDRSWMEFDEYDIIVSNPPYILKSESHLMNTLDHEPHLALFVDSKIGVEQFYKKLALFAETHLLPGGQLFLEINQYSAPEIKDCLAQHGFHTELFQDMQGNDRMLKCCIAKEDYR